MLINSLNLVRHGWALYPWVVGAYFPFSQTLPKIILVMLCLRTYALYVGSSRMKIFFIVLFGVRSSPASLDRVLTSAPRSGSAEQLFLVLLGWSRVIVCASILLFEIHWTKLIERSRCPTTIVTQSPIFSWWSVIWQTCSKGLTCVYTLRPAPDYVSASLYGGAAVYEVFLSVLSAYGVVRQGDGACI